MKENYRYRTIPFTFNRRMVAASATAGRQQNNIHAFMEVDITEPRSIIREHKQRSGETFSLTAYIVTCLARAITEHPHLNAFRQGSKLVILEDVTISVLVEREIAGERVPENLGIRQAQSKSHRHVQDEIRAAQAQQEGGLGSLAGLTWIRFIPSFLFRLFIRLASRNIHMMARYGAVGVTAVGMYAPRNQATWLLPLVGGATVGVAVGGIVERPVLREGQLENREHLCLTVSFNHDLVDGAPAARFLKRFSELLSAGELLEVAPDLVVG